MEMGACAHVCMCGSQRATLNVPQRNLACFFLDCVPYWPGIHQVGYAGCSETEGSFCLGLFSTGITSMHQNVSFVFKIVSWYHPDIFMLTMQTP